MGRTLLYEQQPRLVSQRTGSNLVSRIEAVQPPGGTTSLGLSFLFCTELIGQCWEHARGSLGQYLANPGLYKCQVVLKLSSCEDLV